MSRIFCLHFTQTLRSDVCIVHVHIPTMMKIQLIGHVIWSAKGDGCFTSLKTGYITAYSVMDTMEFVSASFFISSIVILQGGAALGEKVRRKLQLTHTHAYTHPLTHTHSHTLWKTNKLQSDKSLTKRKNRDNCRVLIKPSQTFLSWIKNRLFRPNSISLRLSYIWSSVGMQRGVPPVSTGTYIASII